MDITTLHATAKLQDLLIRLSSLAHFRSKSLIMNMNSQNQLNKCRRNLAVVTDVQVDVPAAPEPYS